MVKIRNGVQHSHATECPHIALDLPEWGLKLVAMYLLSCAVTCRGMFVLVSTWSGVAQGLLGPMQNLMMHCVAQGQGAWTVVLLVNAYQWLVEAMQKREMVERVEMSRAVVVSAELV